MFERDKEIHRGRRRGREANLLPLTLIPGIGELIIVIALSPTQCFPNQYDHETF